MTPSTISLDPTTRIERLEKLCTQLWSSEPPVDAAERARLFRQVGDIERRLASMSLQLIVAESTTGTLEETLKRCESRVGELHQIWASAAEDELLAS